MRINTTFDVRFLPPAVIGSNEYDAVVYDLDGTVVHLDVDWDAVATDALAVYERADVDPPSRDLWDLLDGAGDAGVGEAVREVVTDHERAGARSSVRLDGADDLLDRSVPVAVCSLNCEAACRIALDEHDVTDAVDAVVGRDTVENHKPHPEPLLHALDRLSVEPDRALFVGDTERDERTAQRAGTDFEYVGDGPVYYD